MSLDCKCGCYMFIISGIIYFSLFSTICSANEGLECRVDEPFPKVCGENATCVQTAGSGGVCKCLETYSLVNGKCILETLPSSSESHSNNELDLRNDKGSSSAVWILVPCFIILLAGVTFFLIKRLKLMETLYQFRVRRYNTVFVTSLQDDEAPIS